MGERGRIYRWNLILGLSSLCFMTDGDMRRIINYEEEL